MSSIDLVNYLLDNIPKLREKFSFMDDSDGFFLKDYFENSKIFFVLMDSLMKYENNEDFQITETQFDEVTSAVRKVSKKYRDAAKLLHILKKPNLKAFFSSLQQLDCQTYITEPYVGELYEIYTDPLPATQHVDERDYASGSETMSNNSEYSEGSEDVISDKINLPSYQDVAYPISNNGDAYLDYQIIGIQRDHKQPLGITVIKHDFELGDSKISRCMIERILVNSVIDKQGLLQVGDIILEINDQEIDTPSALQRMLTKLTGPINFKVIKSAKRPLQNSVNMEKSFVRALFDYDPTKDALIPSENIGLSFSSGDVFEILNRDDPNFWQVLPLGCTTGQALLVPSQGLQERRIALEDDLRLKTNENNGHGKMLRRKSKKNELFRAQDAADIISEADLRTYEEVVKFPPSRIPCLLLLGPTGIGKRAIKHLIVQREPNRFAFPIQDTTEPKRGRNQPLFNHVDKNTMLSDIKSGLYVCLEDNNGEVYGIKSSTIRELINQNKTVVLDCKPKDVYSLKLPIYNPYVILISAPSLSTMETMQKDGLSRNLTKNKRSTPELQEIIDQSNKYQSMYQHLINSVIINENITKTVHKISTKVSEVENSESWIPAAWENDIIPLPIIPKDVSRDQLKSPDNLSINQTTLQRRFEKKNEKSSLSVAENKQIIVGRSLDVSGSDLSSSSYSENELVRAKPLKYSSVEQTVEDELVNEDVDLPIKPKQRMPLKGQPIVKGESIKEQPKMSKNPQVPPKPLNLKVSASGNMKKDLEPSDKETNKASNKSSLKPQDKTVVHAKVRDDVDTGENKMRKGQDRESKTFPEKETRKMPEKEMNKSQDRDVRKMPDKELNKSQDRDSKKMHDKEANKSQDRDVRKMPDKELNKSQDKDVRKMPDREINKSQSQEKVQPNIPGNRNQKPPKQIKLQESSSSDMSDTTSEDENRGLKENRV